MTTPPEVLELARKIADDISPMEIGDLLSPLYHTIAEKAAIATILKTTELAAQMLDHAYPVAASLRSFNHLKGIEP